MGQIKWGVWRFDSNPPNKPAHILLTALARSVCCADCDATVRARRRSADDVDNFAEFVISPAAIVCVGLGRDFEMVDPGAEGVRNRLSKRVRIRFVRAVLSECEVKKRHALPYYDFGL